MEKSKNKVITIVLSCILIVSIGFNIYFLLNVSKTKEQIAALDGQITNLQAQLDKSNSEISSLNSTISEKESQIEGLETALKESENSLISNGSGNGNGADTLIPDDFPYVDREVETESEAEQTPASSEVAEQPKQEEVQQSVETPAAPVQTTVPQSSSNPPAGLGNMGTFGGSMGTGTGEGAIGSFGNYE